MDTLLRISCLLGVTRPSTNQPDDSENKPLVLSTEPAPLPSNNSGTSPDSSIDVDDPATRNNATEDPQIEQPNVPNRPVLDRETFEADKGSIEKYLNMSPPDRNGASIKDEMMQVMKNVESYPKEVLQRQFNIEKFKQMFQNDENNEQKAETSTGDNNLSDQLLSELGLLAENIDIWLKQNMDSKRTQTTIDMPEGIIGENTENKEQSTGISTGNYLVADQQTSKSSLLTRVTNILLNKNLIGQLVENRMNHQQLQNAEGEEVPGIPGDEGVNALVMNRLLNITAVDILVEAPPAEELPVRHVTVNMPRITDDDRRNEAATAIPRNPSSGAIVVDTPVEASLVRQSDWCSQPEMIIRLLVIVVVVIFVPSSILWLFGNNPYR